MAIWIKTWNLRLKWPLQYLSPDQTEWFLISHLKFWRHKLKEGTGSFWQKVSSALNKSFKCIYLPSCCTELYVLLCHLLCQFGIMCLLHSCTTHKMRTHTEWVPFSSVPARPAVQTHPLLILFFFLFFPHTIHDPQVPPPLPPVTEFSPVQVPPPPYAPSLSLRLS